MSSIPRLNQPLPDFSLPAAVPGTDGAIEETTITPADFRGRPLVLFFYPKDATCGCTIEVCGFRDLYGELQEVGAAIVGVSRDTVRSHRRFIENQNLPYPLAADPGATLIKAWGLLINGTMYGKPVTKVLRTTFVVDGAGVVREIYEKVAPAGHAQEVLEAVRRVTETGQNRR